MQILVEIKLALIHKISDAQNKIKKPSARLNNFFILCGTQMAEAETAADLAQSVRTLIDSELAHDWLNPLWYFSYENQVRTELLKILNSENYSLLNLLIKTNREDRQLIRQLESEAHHHRASLGAAGISPTLIADYEHRLSAYADRHEIDQRRINGLRQATDELIEENTRLKDQTATLSLVTHLTKMPGFREFMERAELSASEKSLVASYFSAPAEGTATPRLEAPS